MRRQRVLHRFRDEPLLPKLGTSTAVEGRHHVMARSTGDSLSEALPQDLGEEMIAIPAPCIVQQHDKQVGKL